MLCDVRQNVSIMRAIAFLSGHVTVHKTRISHDAHVVNIGMREGEAQHPVPIRARTIAKRLRSNIRERGEPEHNSKNDVIGRRRRGGSVDAVGRTTDGGAKLPDLRRKQHATQRGGGNEDVSVSVRVSSALRLASDSRRGQNTVIFCLLPTNESDGRRATLHAACSSISRYALNVSLTAFLSYDMFIICMCVCVYIYIYMYYKYIIQI